jgi:hypothetical protein
MRRRGIFPLAHVEPGSYERTEAYFALCRAASASIDASLAARLAYLGAPSVGTWVRWGVAALKSRHAVARLKRARMS